MPRSLCVVFDLDDTLFKEVDYVRSGFAAVAAEVFPVDQRTRVRDFWNLYDESPVGVFDRWARMHPEFGARADELVDIYRNHQPTLSLDGEVREVLRSLRESGSYLGVLTDGRARSQRAKLRALGVDAFFDAIVVSEEIGHEKPSIEGYIEISKWCPANSYCYVGDNIEKDFLGANRLGWTTVRLRDNGQNIRPEGRVPPTPEYEPRYVISSMRELLGLLPIDRLSGPDGG